MIQRKQWWWIKTSMDNKKKMDYIRRERMKKDKDPTQRSYDRVLTAILRHEKFVQDVINADFIDDRKAQFTASPFNIFRFVIIIFMAVVFFGGLIYVTGLLNNAFIDIGIKNEANAGQPGYVNLTLAAQNTWGQFNNSIQGLRLVAVTMIFAEILLIFVLNSFVRVHPAMFIVWVFIVFLAVMLAAPISNSYEALLQSSIYDGGLRSFTGANFILLNLPIVTLFVGIFGGLFMFINILRGGNEEAL